MGHEAEKTEHAGAKKGNGAYWGRKKDAKHESNKKRRSNDKETSKDKDLWEDSFWCNQTADDYYMNQPQSHNKSFKYVPPASWLHRTRAAHAPLN